MVKKNPKSPPISSSKPLPLSELIVTLAVGLVALALVGPQLAASSNPGNRTTLSMLDQRVGMLRPISDPVKRDAYCIPLSAYGRALDRAIDKDARVFFSGLVGKTNGGKAGYFYFLQNHLFPRRVDISLGTNATFHCEYFEGVGCDSADVLRSNGYDLMIQYGADGIQLLPLTQKGVPRE